MPRYGRRKYASSQRYRRRRRYARRKFIGYKGGKTSSVAKAVYTRSVSSRPRRVYTTISKWLRRPFRRTRAISGFPSAQFVKLRYSVSLWPFSGGALPAALVSIRGNSPYDPEEAAGGGQPRWFDQYAARYRSHLCHGSAIKLWWSSINSAGEAGPFRIGVQAVNYNAKSNVDYWGTTDGADRIKEMRFTKSRLCDIQSGLPFSATGAQRNFRLKTFATTKQINGLAYDRYSCGCSVTGNVTSGQDWYWHVLMAQQYASNDFTTNFLMHVTVEYYVTFYNRIPTWDA